MFQGQSQFKPFVLYPNHSHVSVQIPSEAMYFEKGATQVRQYKWSVVLVDAQPTIVQDFSSVDPNLYGV